MSRRDREAKWNLHNMNKCINDLLAICCASGASMFAVRIVSCIPVGQLDAERIYQLNDLKGNEPINSHSEFGRIH